MAAGAPPYAETHTRLPRPACSTRSVACSTQSYCSRSDSQAADSYLATLPTLSYMYAQARGKGGSVAPERPWSGGRPAPFFARWRDPWQSADACDAPASSAADTPRPTTKMSASASMYVPFSSVQQDDGVAVHAPGRTPGTRGGGSRMGSAESDYCKTRPDECPHGTAAGRTGRQGQAALPSPGRLRDSAAARPAHVRHWRVRWPAC